MVITIGKKRMNCYKCRTKQELSYNKVHFRAVCPNCDADLHVCRNCRHYIIGKPNDCNVPNSEFVSDRESNNFCEDFSPKDSIKKEIKKNKEDIAKKLFQDDELPPKNDFNSLFKD